MLASSTATGQTVATYKGVQIVGIANLNTRLQK